MSELLLFIDAPASGMANMARDVELLERCARGEIAGAVRVYSFEPACLSIGRLQDLGDVDEEACALDGIDVVRRPSGGRAVLHEHEVTYAVVCRATDPVLGGRVLEACARIHRAVAAGLAGLGVATEARAASAGERAAAQARAAAADCFAKPSAHELVDQAGRKLVGSAQARRGDALLQHGSVMLAPHRVASYLVCAVPGTTSSSLVDILGREVSRHEVAAALVAGFEATLGDRLARHSMMC